MQVVISTAAEGIVPAAPTGRQSPQLPAQVEAASSSSSSPSAAVDEADPTVSLQAVQSYISPELVGLILENKLTAP
jgi:hypothetical protein